MNLNFFGTREKAPVTFAGRKKPEPVSTPIPAGVAGGRESTPESMSLLGFLTNELAQVEPDFELELIRLIEHLAKYNGDVSYAVDNVVQLANTPYSIYFGDEVEETLAKEMALVCKEGEEEVYNGKLNALINDLLAQAVITGAVSGEIVPNERLDDIMRVVLVATGSIKFLYDAKLVNYMPYQKSAVTLANKLGVGNLTKLNPVTYKYYALRRFGEKPYAIPPLLSALEAIAIEKDMIKGLKSIVKKLGVFGFMTMLITPPKKKVGMGEVESDEAYWKRCEAHLNMVRAEAEKGFASGLVLGFKDSHEIKLENTLANMTGTSELFKLVGEFKFAGLKQDPLMLGRNYNIAETMARVILAKLTTQIQNYQLTVASFLENYFKLKLLLRGYNKIGNLKVEFERAMVSDKKMEEDAYGKRIQNQRELYADGIIDQNTRANALGFEQAAEKEPRPGFDKEGNPIPPGEKMPEGKQDPTVTKDKRAARVSNEQGDESWEDLADNLGGYFEEFRYNASVLSRSYHNVSFVQANEALYNYLNAYFRDVKVVYSAASRQISKKIADALGQLGPGASEQMVYDKVMYVLYKNWQRSFNQPIKETIAKHVTEAYTYFRKDKAPLNGKDGEKVSSLTSRDLKAIEYMKRSDGLYLGKFITDESTKKRIRDFVREQMDAGNLPLGGEVSARVVEQFRNEFETLMDMQDWKIINILSTTTNKMQNYAALSQLDKAGITTFEVRGVADAKQCSTCKAMQGRKFSVATAIKRIDDEISGSPAYAGTVKPFATSVFKGQEGLKEMESLTDEAMQLRGVDTPPYHGNCRDRIYAV